MFESNVIYIGTKTNTKCRCINGWFGSNVIYIGTKTLDITSKTKHGLRVM